ncbi:hypothetical protein ACQ86G_11325 [Roseateles chitinivorans]|uniref:hypothetical protein n=1 Tax=Roseateles chitinivorans TaxID=2917965 RepID=UPI003D66D89A
MVRDLLGREQIVVQPYYISPSLLKPGLSAYSVEAGWLRLNYGIDSNRYGRAVLAGTWRNGLTPVSRRNGAASSRNASRRSARRACGCSRRWAR